MASSEAERRRPVEGTEQSPILDARAMRLFPTVVWRAEIRPDACRRINEAIVAKLAALRRGTAAPAAGRGWQSGHDLHELHEFRELTEIIDVTVKDVLDYLRIGEVAFEMSGCWANMNAPGAAHGLHSHPNNFLSGVYYVRVPNGGDTINFHDPRSQTGILRPPVVELTADNTDQVVMRVGEGTVLLFPAWLPHSVDANRGDRDRISVSFNIMLSDYTVQLSAPLWQGERH
jgi:uncharacterized protein (TIGR02466 family)